MEESTSRTADQVKFLYSKLLKDNPKAAAKLLEEAKIQGQIRLGTQNQPPAKQIESGKK